MASSESSRTATATGFALPAGVTSTVVAEDGDTTAVLEAAVGDLGKVRLADVAVTQTGSIVEVSPHIVGDGLYRLAQDWVSHVESRFGRAPEVAPERPEEGEAGA